MHRLALVFDLVAEAREAFAAAVEHAVDDVGDVALPGSELSILSCGELEVRDRLAPEPGPDRPLGRRRLGFVDATTHEVEERGRELVRARLASLSKERGNECGLGIGRRLLLVLAVVSRAALAAHEPEHRPDDEDRRERREAERDEPRSKGMGLQRVDALAVPSRSLRVRALLRDDPVEGLPARDAHARGRRERRRGG